MSYSQNKLINAAVRKAYGLVDYNVHNDIHKQHEFRCQTVLADESLTENEKSEAVIMLTTFYDKEKVTYNSGIKRICENCSQECLATLFCEYCVQNYLKAKFSNWTSGNNNIDNLLQECQMKTLIPNKVVEWILYNNLQNIKYLTKGGCSEIYTADWIDGSYEKWDSKEQQLKRFGRQEVILKRLENVESANQSWFEEAKSHLTISNKWTDIVQCFGLTQDPSNGDYILIMSRLDTDLRKYLQQNHNQLTWKERIQITADIIEALKRIHDENAIHRDLHSGNILFNFNNPCYISDLGFCGPANKPLKSIYGNLPYIAPEVIIGKEQTFKSDIYSIAMLMWEISSGQPPFLNYKDNYDLAMYIVNGIRPKIVPGIPLEYKNLMKQCWNADPLKRPDINILLNKINILNLYYQSKSNELLIQLRKNNNLEENSLKSYYNSSKIFTSNLHQFENLPEPKNATEEEQELFHSKSHDFYIPDNIDDFDKSVNQKNNTSKISSIFKVNSNKLFKIFKRSSKNDYKNETIQQQTKDKMYNNPNIHLEEQDKLELSDNKLKYCCCR